MSKIGLHRKPAEGREVKYLQFKSFHINKFRNSKLSREESKSSTCSEPLKVKVKSSKKSAQTVVRQESAHKGDNIVRSDPNLYCKNLEALSLQIPQISAELHEKLKADLVSSKNRVHELQQELAQLKVCYGELSNANIDLKQIIAKLESKNENLQDQIELDSDQIKSLLQSQDKNEELLKKLQSSICCLENDKEQVSSQNEKLKSENKELCDLINELRLVTEEKDRAVDNLCDFKEKWENYKIKLQHAMHEKEELAQKIADDAKFVAVLETDVCELRQKNKHLEDVNDLLQKDIAERKKAEDVLCHKYEELKKQNKTSKEKSKRSCGSHVSSSQEVRDEKDLQTFPSLLSCIHVNKNKSNQEKNAQDRAIYDLLHRSQLERGLRAKRI